MKFMGSLLAGGNKKDRVDQYKLVAKMRFYGFGGVGFLFKTFKHTHPKSLAPLFEAHTHAEYWAKNNGHSIHLPPF